VLRAVLGQVRALSQLVQGSAATTFFFFHERWGTSHASVLAPFARSLEACILPPRLDDEVVGIRVCGTTRAQ